MALGSLPPWLQINPRDYLLATQAGAQMGHAISDATTRAFEEQERMKMAAEHQKSVLAQQAIENAMQRLAAERLENYRQQEVKNREAELGIQRQGLGLRGEGLDIQRQRVEDLAKTNEQRIKDAEERERDRQAQRDFMNDMREREMQRREKEAERARQGHFLTKDGIDYVIPPGATNAVPVAFPKPPEDQGSHETLDTLKRIGGSLLKNVNFMGITPFGLSSPAQGTINAPPAIPTTPTPLLSATNTESTPKRFKYNPDSGNLEPVH